MIKISPSLLSYALLPLSLAWIVSAILQRTYSPLPNFWSIMFCVGGPVALFLAGMLITIRRRDRSQFAVIDRVALLIASVGTILSLVLFGSLWLRNQ